MTITIGDLAQQIHETATTSGFWDEERNMGEMLMLVVSELAECLEEHRDGHDPIWFQEGTGKPEGMVIELADAVIRCLDTLYAKWDLKGKSMTAFIDERREMQESASFYKLSDNFGENLLTVSELVTRAKLHYIWLIQVVIMCERLVRHNFDMDIWGAVQMKMEYNTTRPYKHGKGY